MNKKQTIRLNESQLRYIVSESVKRVLKENTSNISTLEDLCSLLGCSINEQEEVQIKIEKLLMYLRSYGIIDRFDEDKLDWLFSDEQSY